jgi:hypothetical protein
MVRTGGIPHTMTFPEIAERKKDDAVFIIFPIRRGVKDKISRLSNSSFTKHLDSHSNRR